MDVNERLDQLTLEEQVSLLAGVDFWTTSPVKRIGIPAIKVTDGPSGARGGGSFVGGIKSACFPCAISVGSTWDTDLAKQMGVALAEEAKSKNALVLLAPTVNIHRSGLNGRNFECYSEDPKLTSKLAVAYIDGVQSQGVAATIKHFVGNESEIERQTISSEIGERALREIYMPPFEAAVKTARVKAVMTGYNKLNGTYASENNWLLNEVLRGEWAFDGIVMSDWFGSHSTADTINAGLDLEMPGPTRDRGQKLIKAVNDGIVSEKTVRESAKRMMKLMDWVGAFNEDYNDSLISVENEKAQDLPRHRALIRKIGAEGTVLLKNDDILPLDKNNITSLAVIGPNAAEARIMGGGSAQINAHYRVSPLQGLKSALGGNQIIIFEQGCNNNRLLKIFNSDIETKFYSKNENDDIEIHADTNDEGEYIWIELPFDKKYHKNFRAIVSGEFKPEVDGVYDFGVACAGLAKLYVDDKLVVNAHDDWKVGENFFGFGCDEVRSSMRLNAGQSYRVVVKFQTADADLNSVGLSALRVGIELPLSEDDIAKAVEIAKNQPIALLFVGREGEWDTEGLDLPHMRLPGAQDQLIKRVAEVNSNVIVILQSGGPIEMPWLKDVKAVLQMWYPGQELGNSFADIIFGDVSPGGRLPQTFPKKLLDNSSFSHDPISYPGEDGVVRYDEGVFVGYRHHDTHEILPKFPFGFGLSYSVFKWEKPKISNTTLSEQKIQVSIEIKNIGLVKASEVVQLYMQPIGSKVDRPKKELCDFAKIYLEPDKSGVVNLEVGLKSLSYFDVDAGEFIADKGKYELLLAASSQDIRSIIRINLAKKWCLGV